MKRLRDLESSRWQSAPTCAKCKKPVEHFETWADLENCVVKCRARCHGDTEERQVEIMAAGFQSDHWEWVPFFREPPCG